MSRMTNHAENKLADFFRGQGLTLPSDWHFALGSAADDASFTEVTGTSYARVSVTRNLTNFCGTQGAATTTVSSGTSNTTRNNGVIAFPTAGAGGWTTANFVGLFDASSGGNCWFYGPLGSAVTVASGASYSIAVSAAVFELGLTGGLSTYLANKLIDLIWRAQAFSWPSTTYIRLVTTTPTNAAGGVEVSGGSYARASIASSLSAWSGTQSAGSTTASSGTAGRISNNAEVAFPAPTANWGTVTHAELMDALTSGNRLFWAPLSPARTITSGALPPKFSPNTFGITLA